MGGDVVRRLQAWAVLLVVLVFVVWTAAVAAAAAGPPSRDERSGVAGSVLVRPASSTRQLTTVPGRVLVHYAGGSTAASRRSVAAAAGGRLLRLVPARWLTNGARLAVVVSGTESTGELLRRLEDDPGVAYAEPDFAVTFARVPNDPFWEHLWGLRRIRAPRAWDTGIGGPGIVVADIDTGVDYTHEDLAANMWRNPGEIPGNSVDDDANGYVDDVHGISAADRSGDPMDDYWHGTHTSGTIAAVGDNASGVAGVAWTAQIMALKFINTQNTGTMSDAITCIDYILDQKAKGANVVAANASWNLPEKSLALKDAIDALGRAGVLFCASAGNFTSDNDATVTYPACYASDAIIAVAATDQDDELAVFSDWGRRTVDLAAPGVGIVSTAPSNSYVLGEGTSMAAPHVAGAVALLAAQRRAADTPARLKGRLLGTVVDLDLPLLTGGRLDLAAAVAAPTDTRPPRAAVRDAVARAGRKSRLWLRDYDVLSPRVTTTLIIADRDGTVRQRLRWHFHSSLAGWWSAGFACRLPAGTYRMRVTSTDLSGNSATSAKATLRVR